MRCLATEAREEVQPGRAQALLYHYPWLAGSLRLLRLWKQMVDGLKQVGGSPRKQPMEAPQDIRWQSQNALGLAALGCLHNLLGGTLGRHREQGQAGAQREPAKLLLTLPLEFGM